MKIEKLAALADVARNAGVPPAVLAVVLISSNHRRQRALFLAASGLLLAAHKAKAPVEVLRYFKSVVDLVRARMAVTGSRRPTVDVWLSKVVTGAPVAPASESRAPLHLVVANAA